MRGRRAAGFATAATIIGACFGWLAGDHGPAPPFALLGQVEPVRVTVITLRAGQRIVLAQGLARPGDWIVCPKHARQVRVHVPLRGHGTALFADGKTSGITLDVATRNDGAVVARCG